MALVCDVSVQSCEACLPVCTAPTTYTVWDCNHLLLHLPPPPLHDKLLMEARMFRTEGAFWGWG